MNATQLLENFDRLAEAPEAVPRLRRFILDLAVRGKLVQQDPNDEPASELLKQIETEIARLVKVGQMRKPKPLPSIESENEPFEAPLGWQWVRMRQVTSDRGQSTPTGEFTYIDVGSINKEAGTLGEHKVLSASEAPSRARKVVSKGDVLYACVRPTLLNIAVVEEEITPTPIASTAFAVLNSFGFVLPKYLWISLRSPYLEAIVEAGMRGQAYPAINDAEFALLPLALPPLAEQHRIVAKVDELMTLCDQLETAQQERERRRDSLVAASLQRLNQPAADTAPEAQREHARFHLDHLPSLTTRPAHIKAMRRSILNLAVHGRLVRQDKNDETAADLLRRVDRRREKLLQTGYPNSLEARTQLRKQATQALPAGLDSLPRGWAWATLMQCAVLVIDCHNKTAPYSTSGTPLIRTTNVRDGYLNLKEPKFVDGATYERWSARCEPEAGDILITREAPMGEVALIPAGMKICLGQRMMLARLVPETIDPQFLLYSLRDPRLMDRVQDKPIGATVQHLRVGGIETLLIPLPPLAEQHRIVAKVDQLMGLCDQLEAQLTTSRTDSRRLLEAVLQQAFEHEDSCIAG
jgi:type I restriction enzyme S subunit